jgi:hypothetical protein
VRLCKAAAAVAGRHSGSLLQAGHRGLVEKAASFAWELGLELAPQAVRPALHWPLGGGSHKSVGRLVSGPAGRCERLAVEESAQSGVFRCENFWRKVPVALFVVIWQNLSNHGLTRLKRFMSTFTDKLCNQSHNSREESTTGASLRGFELRRCMHAECRCSVWLGLVPCLPYPDSRARYHSPWDPWCGVVPSPPFFLFLLHHRYEQYAFQR